MLNPNGGNLSQAALGGSQSQAEAETDRQTQAQQPVSDGRVPVKPRRVSGTMDAARFRLLRRIALLSLALRNGTALSYHRRRRSCTLERQV